MDVRLDTLREAVRVGIITDYDKKQLLAELHTKRVAYETAKQKKARKAAKRDLQEFKKKLWAIEEKVLAPKDIDKAVWFFTDLAKLFAYYMGNKDSLFYFRLRIKHLSGKIEIGSIGEHKLVGLEEEYNNVQRAFKDSRENLKKIGMEPAFSEEIYNLYLGAYEALSKVAVAAEEMMSLCDKKRLYAQCHATRDQWKNMQVKNKHAKLFKIHWKTFLHHCFNDDHLAWDESFLSSAVADIRLIEGYIADGVVPPNAAKGMKLAIKQAKKFLMAMEADLINI